MSLLQDEQLEKLEGQGRKSQLYKIEFFFTVTACVVIAVYVLSQNVPEGQSSIPITLEATIFAIVLALLASPWAGRLVAVIFALACAVFVAVKINSFSDPNTPYYNSSFYLWTIGSGLFLLILIIWKAVNFTSSDNKEAREYEKYMRKIGKW